MTTISPRKFISTKTQYPFLRNFQYKGHATEKRNTFRDRGHSRTVCRSHPVYQSHSCALMFATGSSAPRPFAVPLKYFSVAHSYNPLPAEMYFFKRVSYVQHNTAAIVRKTLFYYHYYYF